MMLLLPLKRSLLRKNSELGIYAYLKFNSELGKMKRGDYMIHVFMENARQLKLEGE
jgi:hypothetical protein